MVLDGEGLAVGEGEVGAALVVFGDAAGDATEADEPHPASPINIGTVATRIRNRFEVIPNDLIGRPVERQLGSMSLDCHHGRPLAAQVAMQHKKATGAQLPGAGLAATTRLEQRSDQVRQNRAVTAQD